VDVCAHLTRYLIVVVIIINTYMIQRLPLCVSETWGAWLVGLRGSRS
jgi:hypothetical protein